MDDLTARTWAEIDLGNIEHNYRVLRSRLKGNCKFLGVVKADGYGHGAVQVARRLKGAGCEYLATATVFEAVSLRQSGLDLPILVLGFTPAENASLLLQNDITQSISDVETASKMASLAKSENKKLKVHIKLDSGMGRLGFRCCDGSFDMNSVLSILKMDGLDPEGVFTHFAVSEISDPTYTKGQFSDFTRTVSEIESAWGHKFKIKHCANSAATMMYEEMQLDMVRPGIALYGCAPGDSLCGLDLRQAMELKTRIYSIKTMPKGASVSYGRNFIAPSDRKIAVIPVGYADGLHRVLSNRIEVLVAGKRVKQVGNICMDMCMIDVTDIENVSKGDVVTLFGRDGENFIPIEEMAHKAGTIAHEIMCGISKRIPRVYK